MGIGLGFVRLVKLSDFRLSLPRFAAPARLLQDVRVLRMNASIASQTHQLLPAQSATLEVSGSPSASLLICNHVPDAGNRHGLAGALSLLLFLLLL